MGRRIAMGLAVAALVAVGAWALVRPSPLPGDAPADAQAKLAAVPLTVGRWTGRDVPVNDRTMLAARADAHLSREYRDAAGGAAVSVLVLYGEPGDMGAHTPEVCYGGAGYTPCGRAERRTVGEKEAAQDLWRRRFQSGNAPGTQLDVWWGWGVGGRWVAADDPRAEFFAHGRIHKVYASRTADDAADPVPAFLAAFLPALSAATAADPTTAR